MTPSLPIPPGLYGDGLQDDTEAIQHALDTGISAVYLPPAPAHYVINRTLRLHSNQALVLDRFTRVRLAPKSDCPMLANADQDRGNENVAVTGGIWDMDNTSQTPNPIATGTYCPPDKRYDPAYYLGVLMRFVRVKNLAIRSLTFSDPVNFCVQMARISQFTVEDITFDFPHWNPIPGNMDGIHLDGCCRFGAIRNLKGTTYDDLVALNADDGEGESPCFGPIEDIAIDGIFATDCHSAVRILSNGSWVRRISIANVYGTYYQYVVGITNAFQDRGTEGAFDHLTLRDVYASKATRHSFLLKDNHPVFPIVWCERATHVGNLAIEGLHRDEENVAAECIAVSQGARVDTLTVDGASYANHTGKPAAFLGNEGEIGMLALSNVDTRGDVLLDNGGRIATLSVDGVVSHGVPARPAEARPKWSY